MNVCKCHCRRYTETYINQTSASEYFFSVAVLLNKKESNYKYFICF